MSMAAGAAAQQSLGTRGSTQTWGGRSSLIQRQNRNVSRRQAVQASSQADASGVSSSSGRNADTSRRRPLARAIRFGGICAAAAAAQAAAPAILGAGGGGGGLGLGGWGGGGGGGGFGRLLGLAPALAEEAEDDEEEEVEYEEVTDDEAGDGTDYAVEEPDEEGGKAKEDEDEEEFSGDDDDEIPYPTKDRFFVSEIRVTNLPVGKGIPTQEDLFAGLKCQPGFVCTRAEMSEDLRTLYQLGIFEKVDARVVPKPGKKRILEFDFKDKVFPPITSFRLEGSTLVPKEVEARVMKELKQRKKGPTTLETLSHIKSIIEGWYLDRGYAYSYITSFSGLDTGNAAAIVNESKVNKVAVVWMDDEGQPVSARGKLRPEVIERELSIRPGQIYNLEDGRKALRDVFGLQLFDNVQVLPKQQPTDESKIDVDVMVKERPMQTAEIEAEWSIAPNDNGKPTLVSMVPGGTLTYEHQHLGNTGQKLAATVNATNLLMPEDSLSFRVDWKQPYVFGDWDPKKTALVASAFNVRKVSGVFMPGPGGEEVPPVFIDRSGVKIAVQEQYSRNSKGTYGLVVEQVSALGEQGEPMTNGSKVIQVGQGAMLEPNGPPTTLSSSAVDRLAFLQGNLTRDATYQLNGATIGPRDVLQVEQSLGLGTNFAMFNRATLAATRFIKLRDAPEGSTSPPATLVLHGRVGNIVGDMASYDAFTLGGPASVRGFNVGELAACRRFAETAVELRMPVLGRQLFGFYEHGTDLSSSKLVRGNPTEYYRRAGSGTSIGGGIKLGAVRVEYATEGASWDSGNVFVRFGERF